MRCIGQATGKGTKLSCFSQVCHVFSKQRIRQVGLIQFRKTLVAPIRTAVPCVHTHLQAHMHLENINKSLYHNTTCTSAFKTKMQQNRKQYIIHCYVLKLIKSSTLHLFLVCVTTPFCTPHSLSLAAAGSKG